MEYAHVILASLFSILALFLITKLLGCRQMNQLSMFDYINGITIGSIAAELAASWGKEFWQWAIALVIYGLATFLLSLATDRSIQARRLITGTPIPLYENGQLLDQNFRRAKLDLNEFLMQCRLAGYFDLSQLEAVLFEPNGMLSILPASPYRPATPFDLERAVEQSTLLVNVILDGKVIYENGLRKEADAELRYAPVTFEGKQYLVIQIDEHLEVNGISVNPETGEVQYNE